MVLCAGRGERLRPLTDRVPKPLIEIAGKPLLSRHLEGLAAAGFREVVINTAHLGARIEAFAGDGSRWGLRIRFSREPEGALETGGGIRNALPLLGPAPFAVINGDVWTDYPLAELNRPLDGRAHLVLVDNPPHNLDGDFGMTDGRLSDDPPKFTFSGIGVYHPRLFGARAEPRFPLAPLLREAMAQGLVGAEHYTGRWFDIGSPERLARARAALDTG